MIPPRDAEWRSASSLIEEAYHADVEVRHLVKEGGWNFEGGAYWRERGTCDPKYVTSQYVRSTDLVTTRRTGRSRRRTGDDLTTTWRVVGAARRYDHVQDQTVDFPTSVFATEYVDGLDHPPTSLTAYLGASITGTKIAYESDWRMCPVCLGPLAAWQVRKGMLDPVDAFWMTGHHVAPWGAPPGFVNVPLCELNAMPIYGGYYLTG